MFKSLFVCFCILFFLGSFVSAESAVGYEYLNDDVLHIWNSVDDYYFDAESMLQLTNHFEDYWARNLFCGGFKISGEWQYSCTDALPFDWTIDSDEETFVSISGYRDITKGNYKVRFGLDYYLALNDTNLSVTPSVENIGELDIPVDLGFAWHLRDIQIAMDEEDNYISVLEEDNDRVLTQLLLSDELDESFTNLEEGAIWIWKELETGWEDLAIYFDPSLPHRVTVKSVPNQYNAPVTFMIKIGTLDIGQKKQTTLGWVDRAASCSVGINPTYVDVKFKRAGQDITEIGSGEEFEMWVKWSKNDLSPGTCNMFMDHQPTENWGEIDEDFPETFDRSVLKTENWNGFTQGQQTTYDTWYTIDVSCGGLADTAKGRGWVGGLTSSTKEIDCNLLYVDQTVIVYVPGASGKAAQVELHDTFEPVVKHQHTDYLGSVRVISNEGGGTDEANNFLPFGGKISGDFDGPNKLGFTGQDFDSGSGLYHLGARYYNPELGRFSQTDPIKNPMQSPYSYANNNPMKFTDTSGKSSQFSQFLRTPQEMDFLKKQRSGPFTDVPLDSNPFEDISQGQYQMAEWEKDILVDQWIEENRERYGAKLDSIDWNKKGIYMSIPLDYLPTIYKDGWGKTLARFEDMDSGVIPRSQRMFPLTVPGTYATEAGAFQLPLQISRKEALVFGISKWPDKELVPIKLNKWVKYDSITNDYTSIDWYQGIPEYDDYFNTGYQPPDKKIHYIKNTYNSVQIFNPDTTMTMYPRIIHSEVSHEDWGILFKAISPKE
ncbi:MAG: RHS repeat-associated core domain-containing protein [Nanoarchaeota archaeon]